MSHSPRFARSILLAMVFAAFWLIACDRAAAQPVGKKPVRSSGSPKTAVVKPAPGPAAPAGMKKVVSVEGITEYRLENGLRLLLYPDDSKPTVTVNLTVFVGSRHEGYGETGMAHLLEHMLFKGTPDHQDIPRLLKDRGAHFNGTTWVDRTNYYETLQAGDDNLKFALALEADRLVNSFVKQEDLLKEMTVVRNEFEQGENSPHEILRQRVMAGAYEWHNYGKSTIGNRSDIERVPIENLQAFYRKHYQPDNVMLVVAGQFDQAAALDYVAEFFGKLPKPQRKLQETYTDEPPQDGERTVTLRRVGDVALVEAAYHVPAGAHPDSAALEVLAKVLGAEPSGRLYKALVESRQASDVFASELSLHDPGLFMVGAEVRRGDPLETARDTLLSVTEGVGLGDVGDDEVDRARQQILKQRELDEAKTSAIAVDLSEWAAQGDWRLYFLHRDRIEQVTPADVRAVAARYLTAQNRTLGMFVPTEKPERTPVPGTPNVAKLVAGYKGRAKTAAGERFDVSPANIERHVERTTLADGIKLALLPKKTKGEAVYVQVVLRYGNLENLKGFVTAAELLPQLMTRGTKRLSRQEVQDTLDRERAVLHARGAAGTATFMVQTKRENLPAVLELLRQILREPALAEDEFELLRRQYLANMEEQLTDPQHQAIVRVRRAVSPYDDDDVRATPTIERDIERIKDLTVGEVARLREEYLGGQAGEVAVVGDFDTAECTAILRRVFSGWVAGREYARIPLIVFPDVQASQQQIDLADKESAVYIAGEAFALSDGDPDYAALTMGNFVLGGGGLSSRLADRVRREEGLSYSVGSFVRAESLDERASLTLFASYNPSNVDKVKTAVREEIEKLLEGGVTDIELAEAKSGYLQAQQVARSDDGRLLGILADTLYTERTMAYYAELERRIAAASADDVLAALRKYIDPAKLAIVVAGDFTAKEPGAVEEKPEVKNEPGE
ncbi:MAG TPA: pitrilysin family protein [Pirellulales bacterium]|nr:pitrilysin family protein [Pirellulales bacterium]